MVTECIAILAISLCLVVVLVRAGYGNYAASVTPILIVPFVHLAALPLSWWTDPLIPPSFPPEIIVAFADIAAVAVSGLLIMFFAGRIHAAVGKKLYVSLLGGYNIILTCTFVHRTLAVLWR